MFFAFSSCAHRSVDPGGRCQAGDDDRRPLAGKLVDDPVRDVRDQHVADSGLELADHADSITQHDAVRLRQSWTVIEPDSGS